jgi:flagellar biosynthesis/type III secretory pathway ATPase
MPQIADQEHKQLAGDIRRLMASYQEAQDLINIGAYQQGSNPLIDKAIKAQANIKNLLIQSTEENVSLGNTLELMKKCIS